MEQAELLRYVVSTLEGLDIPYAIVGSMASSAYGEPRLTQDVDVVIDLPRGLIQALCDAFPLPDYYVSPDAALQAVRTEGQFNVIHPASGNKVDLVIARQFSRDRTELARRRRVLILPDCEGYLAAPEDVILGKMESYRQGGSEKHLRDITGMLKVSGKLIDRAYVDRWARELDVTDVWEAILRRVGWDPPGQEGGEDGGG